MSGKRVGHVALLGLLVLLLLASAYNGLYEGFSATNYADTPGMKVAMVTQFLYGVSAGVGLIALGTRKRWVMRPLVVWLLSTSVTAGLAAVVYGATSVGLGLLTSVATFLLLGLLLWGWHRTSPASLSPLTAHLSP